jgi:hypothetical protein
VGRLIIELSYRSLSASDEDRNGRGNQTFAVTMPFVVIGILLALLAGAIYVAHYGWVSVAT